jgi:diguanylate cyclase (GGDEF)-like protein
VVFTTAVILYVGALNEYLPAVVHIYPYLVAAAGLFLGWRFNRSRLLFAIIVLALADQGLLVIAPDLPKTTATSQSATQTLYSIIAFLLPLNLVFLSWVKERGIITLRGLFRLSLIVFQVLGVYLVYRYQPSSLTPILTYSFPGDHLLAHLALPVLAQLSFGVAFLFLTIRFIQHESVIENGFFWALLSVFLAFVVGKIGPYSTVYFATAGLVLVVSVIETSHRMAFRDELTGIPGRRSLDEAFLKIGGNYSVAMVDIDRFKKFNDRHGHDVGDQVLRMVASKLAQVTGGGKPFRYGGEEFTILFPGKSAAEAMPHLEGVRKAVEETRFIIRGRNRPREKPENPKKVRGSRKKVKITISIGLAERNDKYVTPEQVIKAADKALYKAKKAGRNRIRT